MAWAPDYVTSAQLKAYVRVSDDVDNAQVAAAITAASRAIDRATFRQFGQVTEERTYPGTYDRRLTRPWIVDVDDIGTTTGLVVAVGSTAVTDYALTPRNAVARGMVWTALAFGPNAEAVPSDDPDELVTVTATWGWSAVPAAIEQATLMQASRFLARRDSPFGVAGSPDVGTELRLLARLDPDVETLVRAYRRPWGAR